MKIKKYYTIISIIVLTAIVYFQFNSFYNNAYASYLLDPEYTIDRNNYNNIMYTYVLDALKLKFNDNDNNITIIIDDDYRSYTDGLVIERTFAGAYLYPRALTEVRYPNQLNDGMIQYYLNDGSHTLVYLGYEVDYLNQKYEHDVNIFDINDDGTLVYREGFDSDIYSLSKIFSEHNKSEYSDKLLNVTIKTARIYNNLSAINELRRLADVYYENNLYEEALEIYNICSEFDNSDEIKEIILRLENIVGGD